MNADEISRRLHANIPLTSAMALQVQAFDGQRLLLAMPLAPNRNHHGSAFGGSLATLGIVTGWVLVDEALRAAGLNARVVVQHSDCDYRAPAEAACTATAELPEAWPRFVATLRKHRRARIDIATMIAAEAVPCVQHQGRYAAFLDDPGADAPAAHPDPT